MRKVSAVVGLLVLLIAAAVAFASGSSPSFSFSTDEPGATFTCKLDSGSTTSCSSPKNYTSLSAGTHHLTIISTFMVPTVAAPTAAFTFSPSSPVTGSPVHFDGTTSSCPASPCTYRYADTINNATLGTNQQADFTFQNAGTKPVQLTVTDSSGKTSQVEHDVVVGSPAPPPPPPPPPGGCDLNATPSTFASQFAALQGGQTLCLASGSYGTFTGGNKASRVTVEPQSGASVNMELAWNGVSNITVDGITVTYATIQGLSHDLTISHSTVSPGLIHLLVDQFNHSNILIDHDTFPNTIATTGSGRVWTDFNSVNTTNIIGVTVSNSLFTGGDMIDILIEGGAGLQVLNNEFTGMDNTINENIHSDTIFNFGDQGHNVMKGNWFHDQVDVPACGWAQWDGGDQNVFENNVISHAGGASGHDGCYESMAVLADNGSVISHNTIQAGTGEAGPIGQIDVGHKCAEATGTGAIIRDNVVTEIDQGAGCTSPFTADHNIPSATYVGGAAPNSFAGFALAPGSPGIGAASDGTNIGIELPTGG